VVSTEIVAPSLYSCEVTHVRRSPISNRFDYKGSYWLVDFDQLPHPGGLLGRVSRISADDHLDMRSEAEAAGIVAERMYMLAAARTLGYVFNPISVFWCFDAEGHHTGTLAEVHNTYGGRHAYVLDARGGSWADVDKALYVSPFYPVDGRYYIKADPPTDSVSLTVRLEREGDEPFVATLRGQRRQPTFINVMIGALRYPALRTSARIRWQALRLWWRGLTVQPR